MDIQKQEVREAVELPLTHFELYKQIGIDPPRGVLMFGPPGCGKTMLAKAVAHHTTGISACCCFSSANLRVLRSAWRLKSIVANCFHILGHGHSQGNHGVLRNPV